MRISDCSSDVCSSDLVRIGAPANGDVHRPCEGGEHRGLKQRIVHLAIGRERENARRRRPDDGRPPSGHAPTCNACLYPHDPPGGQALCCCFRRPCRYVELLPHPTLDRSEEHTSELQSLMRISYAACCLKKKNKKTHHAYHST